MTILAETILTTTSGKLEGLRKEGIYSHYVTPPAGQKALLFPLPNSKGRHGPPLTIGDGSIDICLWRE